MSKKILVVCQRFWPEKQKINDICRGFLEKGYKVDVLCGKPNYPEGEFYKGYTATTPRFEKGPGMNVYRAIEMRRGAGSGMNIFFNYLSFSVFSRLKALSLRRNAYDSIFIYQMSPVTMCAPAFAIAGKLKKPVTLYAIDIWPDSAYRELDIQSATLKKILSRISAKYYRNADHVICATRKSYEYMTGTLRIPAGRVSFIPLCPEYGSAEGLKDMSIMEKYAGSFNVLFSGSVSPDQDLDTVIAAAMRMRDAGIRDIRLIIAGRGSDLERLKKLVDKHKLHDMVFFEKAERAEDNLKLSYIADVMLTCRKPAAIGEFYCPQELTDILAAGRPVITTLSNEGRNIINKTGCGYIYDAGNAENLMEVILRLYHFPKEKLEEMGRKAADYQRKYLDRDANIDSILEILFRERETRFEEDGDDDEIIVLKGHSDDQDSFH